MRNWGLFFFRALFLGLLLLTSPFHWNEVHAQVPGLGMGWLLNPEGSRLFPQAIIYPRHPGKPDTRWKVFDWHFRDVHVDQATYRLYFYDVSVSPKDPRPYWTAEFAAPIINLQIEELARDFHFWPRERFSYILFSSYREFQQANVFSIQEGVQGITSTQEPTMAIPYWGERETFRHISHHELVHQFQVQKMNDLTRDRNDSPAALVPLWFIEGMAEFYSLRGVDSEAKSLLRDLWFNPSEESSKKELEDYFEPGPMDFQHVYKLGQLKNAFLEEQFGGGTIQKVLEQSMQKIGTRETPTFAAVVELVTGKKTDELQTLWNRYFQSKVVAGFEKGQDFSAFQRIEGVGDTLDHYEVSRDGQWLLTREVDPLTGSVSIYLAPLATPRDRREVTHDRQGSAVSLYFFQAPSLAVSSNQLAFMALTADGPELEFRTIRRDGSMGNGTRVRLYEDGLVQAHSPTFSPDGLQLAFVGINSKGWQNLYLIDSSLKVRRLTDGASSWKNPRWTSEGILVSCDRVPGTDLYGLFLVDPKDGAARLILRPELGHDNLLEAVGDRPSRELFFRSTNGTGQQIHHWTPKDGTRHVTHVRTQVLQPELIRTDSQDRLLALGFEKGRYRLYEIPRKNWQEQADSDHVAQSREEAPPPEERRALPAPGTDVRAFPRGEIQQYGSFRRGTGARIEDLAAFFSSGSVFGFAGTVSDLMRNYIVSAEFLSLGDNGVSNASVFLTSEKGRSTWTLGAYTTRQARLDAIYDGNTTRLYDYREFGLLGGIQYPLGAFSYTGALLRVGGARRDNFDDATLAAEWNRLNPGTEFVLSPTLMYGFDQIQYELFSGPIRGFGLLLEAETDYFPGRAFATERLRLDVAQYEQLWGRSLLAIQGMAGFSFNLTEGTDFRNPFLVSSDDIFRAYSFGDDRLRGNYLVGAKTELRFPVGEFFGFEPLRGILSADYGSIWRKFRDISSGATASYSGGFAFNIPPLSFSFLLSKPIRVAPGIEEASVFHFTLRYLYL
jgi:hypothetical protein